MTDTVPTRRRLRLGILGGVVLLAATVVIGYQAAASDTAPPDPLELLECPDLSAAGQAEGTYVVGAPPLYIAGFETTDSPEEIAARYAAENQLGALAERTAGSAQISQDEVYRSQDRADIAFRATNDRIIAVVSVVNSNGWKRAGSVHCAG